ncbi:MAG: tetratricopeptide repeat protein [Phycisphaerales bacterium]
MSKAEQSPVTNEQPGVRRSPEEAATVAAGLREGPGTRIGEYKILQLIGEGGFGSVFMAQQEHPVQRKVALKIIKLGMDTHQVVARFEQERQALAMMDHPNIARVLDAGSTETGRPFFVMELVKGDPIVEYCDRNNLSVNDRLELFAQVCQAVQHAHTKGIIHRDIKPSNILVSTLDGRPSTKVIDFGIAKATSARLTEKTLFTEHRQLIGTPEYMSPEQAEGSMDIDTRTDVYSLGVLLYELLTGTTPFSSGELRSAAYAEIQRIIREVEPPVPSTRLSRNSDTIASVAAQRRTEPAKLGSTIRGELDWIVMKALEKDRQRRYETANGLAQDIRRYLAGDPVVAAPPSAVYVFRKMVRRHRTLVASSSAVGAALIVGVVGFAWQAQVARGQRDRAVVAEAAAKKQADELTQVSGFQASMLKQVDAAAAGEQLMSDLNERFRKKLEKDKLPNEERDARTAILARELGEVNATDAAAAMIDRTILRPSVTAIDDGFKDQPRVDAALRHTLADLYRVLGRVDDAVPLQTKAVETRRRELGEDDPATIDSINSLGAMLEAQGKTAEAEVLYREAMEKSRRVRGAEAPLTLDVAVNLGNLLRGLGKYAEAEPILKESLETLRRVKGPEAKETLVALNSYGFLLIEQGKPAEAEPLWREAYQTGKRVFGPDHPDVFVWTNNLAALLNERGKIADAEILHREAFESSRRLRGEDHPQTLMCLRNVASCLKGQARYSEAEPIYRELLEKRRRVLGDDHPSTIDAVADLGMLFTAQRRYAEAEPLARDVLERKRRVLGNEHPSTLNALGNLGYTLRPQGRYEEADRLSREVFEIRRRVLGEEHPATLTTASNLCFSLLDQGKLAEAEAMGRDVLEKRRRVLGPEHPDTLVSTNILSQTIRRQGRLAEAESSMRPTLEASRRLMGPDHPDSILYGANFGGLLLELQKDSEAESLLTETLERATRVLGPKHPTTLNIMIITGSLRKEQSKPAEVLALLAPVESDARAAFTGSAVTRVATLLSDLGWARAALAKAPAEFAAAEASLVEARDIFVAAQGERDGSAVECAKVLSGLYAAWEKVEPAKGYGTKAAEWDAKARDTK